MRLRTGYLLIAAFSALPGYAASTQTLFTRPDTTPNYTAYRHFDECMAAITRLQKLENQKNPLWADTTWVGAWRDRQRLSGHLPDDFVRSTQECISKFNIDSVPLKESPSYARALLIAKRDSDIERLFVRLKDSIIEDQVLGSGYHWMRAYVDARPSRVEKAIQLNDLILTSIPPDSALKGIIERWMLGEYLQKTENHSLSAEIAREITNILDTLSQKYKDDDRSGYLKGFVYPYVLSFMPEAAIDSLSVSTEAYRRYVARIWTSVVGYSPTTEIGPYAKQAPQPTGQYWYSNIENPDSIKSIPALSPIKPGAVTIIYFAQAGCHPHYKGVLRGRNNGGGGSCWSAIHSIRRMMAEFPNINLVVVSHTFGSFADAPPLPPEQEADTLANYFLGFHKLRGVQVVSKTDFMTLENYDRRKIDVPTENQIAYSIDGSPLAANNLVVFVDEKGEIFHFGSVEQMLTGYERLKVVMNRPANRQH